MLIDSLTYHARESGWRLKKALRWGLAKASQLRKASNKNDPNQAATIGYSHLHLAPARDTLQLRDFAPQSMLRARTTEVRRARYPVIDVHCHLNDGVVMQGYLHPKQFIRVMDEANVKACINLTGGWGERLRKSIDDLAGKFPGRFFVFTQIDYSRIDEPNYLIETLEEAHAAGAKGVKVLKDLGLTVRDRRGKLVRIDDPRLDCVWERAGRLGMPVGIHTADPDAFFARVDRHNERYQQLIVHPDWSFFGKGFPNKPELLAQRNHVFEKHPGTRFWGLHMANHPEDLDEVTEWMERYPNLVVELGGRLAELGRQPRRARQFLEQFQDRVMFGMDTKLSVDCYRTYFRFFETDDEAFDYPGYPWMGAWKIYGVNLPDDVLLKFYHDNAARELGLPPLARSERLSYAGAFA
ncbi:MAG TPA: amidohydrolase family protein [Bryobacteraceae bacterium]|jgi:predicted TIM-barrel fold metal-dependent hydrolase|nr:amidohydrolase family protein [Bryobacteraceae bacterium]